MKKLWETGILLFAAAGFWGMIYPDFCFVPDVCKVEYVSEEAQEEGKQLDGEAEWPVSESGEAGSGENGSKAGYGDGSGKAADGAGRQAADLYTRICAAEPGQVKVKSRLLEFFRK